VKKLLDRTGLHDGPTSAVVKNHNPFAVNGTHLQESLQLTTEGDEQEPAVAGLWDIRQGTDA